MIIRAGEDVDQHYRHEEVGQSRAKHHRGDEQAVEKTPVPLAGQYPEQNTQEEREQRCTSDQAQRFGQAGADEGTDRQGVIAARLAEVEARQAEEDNTVIVTIYMPIDIWASKRSPVRDEHRVRQSVFRTV